jgi:hypothetical protein
LTVENLKGKRWVNWFCQTSMLPLVGARLLSFELRMGLRSSGDGMLGTRLVRSNDRGGERRGRGRRSASSFGLAAVPVLCVTLLCVLVLGTLGDEAGDEAAPHGVGRRRTLLGEPTEWDADGDGLSDEDELRYGTDPRKADTDGDGLNDWEEINVRFHFQCFCPSEPSPSAALRRQPRMEAPQPPGLSRTPTTAIVRHDPGTSCPSHPISQSQLPTFSFRIFQYVQAPPTLTPTIFTPPTPSARV